VARLHAGAQPDRAGSQSRHSRDPQGTAEATVYCAMPVKLQNAARESSTESEAAKPSPVHRDGSPHRRVDRDHPLTPWITSYGLSELDLQWFSANPQTPDILGLDYYPHSDWQLDMVGGAIKQRRAEHPVGLHGVSTAYYNRYGIPLMLTETALTENQSTAKSGSSARSTTSNDFAKKASDARSDLVAVARPARLGWRDDASHGKSTSRVVQSAAPTGWHAAPIQHAAHSALQASG